MNSRDDEERTGLLLLRPVVEGVGGVDTAQRSEDADNDSDQQKHVAAGARLTTKCGCTPLSAPHLGSEATGWTRRVSTRSHQGNPRGQFTATGTRPTRLTHNVSDARKMDWIASLTEMSFPATPHSDHQNPRTFRPRTLHRRRLCSCDSLHRCLVGPLGIERCRRGSSRRSPRSQGWRSIRAPASPCPRPRTPCLRHTGDSLLQDSTMLLHNNRSRPGHLRHSRAPTPSRSSPWWSKAPSCGCWGSRPHCTIDRTSLQTAPGSDQLRTGCRCLRCLREIRERTACRWSFEQRDTRATPINRRTHITGCTLQVAVDYRAPSHVFFLASIQNTKCFVGHGSVGFGKGPNQRNKSPNR